LSGSDIVCGISKQDIEWLADQLVEEHRESTGESISRATALSSAVGCTYTAARMWLSGAAMPRRHAMILQINRLIEERYPLFTLRVSRGDLAILELMAGEMRIGMGSHGKELAARLQEEIDRVRKKLGNQN